jgi:hypothetical protein
MITKLPATNFPSVPCLPFSDLTNDDQNRQWYVFRTHSRQEKSLARDLERLAIPHYLPLNVRKLFYRRRTAWSYSPVFAGIVFVFANDEECRACQQTGRTAAYIKVSNSEGLRSLLRKVASRLEQDEDSSGVPGAPPDEFDAISSAALREVMRSDLVGCEAAILDHQI